MSHIYRMHSVLIVPDKERPKIHSQWVDLWLSYIAEHAAKFGYSFETSALLCQSVKPLFTESSKHPKLMDIRIIRAFLERSFETGVPQFKFVHQGLLLLYESLAIDFPKESADRITAISNVWLSKREIMLKRLSGQLSINHFSSNAESTYFDAVKQYLDNVKCKPMPSDKILIETYLHELREIKKLSVRTVNLAAAAITFFYCHVIQSPTAISHLPRIKLKRSVPHIYSLEEISCILSAVSNEKHKSVLMLAYGCGLTLSEIMHLKTADIMWNEEQIKIRGKARKERLVPLDETLGFHLKKYLSKKNKSVFVFEGQKPGKVLSKRSIEKIYDNALLKAGIQKQGGIHCLRHSFATHLLDQGIGIRQLQKVMGHANIKTTEIYKHVSSSQNSKIISPLYKLKGL